MKAEGQMDAQATDDEAKTMEEILQEENDHIEKVWPSKPANESVVDPPLISNSLPADANISIDRNGKFTLSDKLASLLLHARSNYDWPNGTGALQSQERVIHTLTQVRILLRNLDSDSAYSIVVKVSRWAGNNDKAQRALETADSVSKQKILEAILNFFSEKDPSVGLRLLCNLKGISLVIASKIYRFVLPREGAAVDRHASYFTNSLRISEDAKLNFGTNFRREWSNGRHVTSRLAIYNSRVFEHNFSEYLENYLLLLKRMADSLNSTGKLYQCMLTKKEEKWTPADIEMAAYFWWAKHGSR